MPAILPVSIVSPRAVEDVVDDLERDPEREPELAEALVPRAEQARGLEELSALERDPLEVRLDRRVRVVELRRWSASPRASDRQVSERIRDALEVAGLGELREGAREEVVARGARGVGAVRVPDGGSPAAELRTVDQVVVHERRGVHELDRHAAAHRALAVVGGQVDEQRPKPLPAGVERVAHPRARRRPGSARSPRGGAPRARRGTAAPACEDRLRAHARSPTCSATIPPASSRCRTFANPARCIASARSSGPGNRRTLAGR